MPTYQQEKEFTETIVSRSALDDAIDWIKKNLDPADVFDEAALEAWAENNGYTK